jgi:uncharacterized protein (DUF1501 family)
MTAFRTDCEGFHRRDVLKFGAAGLLGLGLPELLRLEAQAEQNRKPGAPARKANAVIMIWLSGGPATIDMWDPKPEAPEGIRGEFKPIDTNVRGVQISEHLPKMAKVADKISLVRSLAHSIPAHGPATVFMTTGNKPTPALQYPSYGSLATKLLETEVGVPPAVNFGGNQTLSSGYLGTAYNPFLVEGSAAGGKGGANLRVRGIQLPDGFSLNSLQDRDALLQDFDSTFRNADRNADLVDGMDAFHKKALEILRSDKTKKAFNLGLEPAALRERYGMAAFGQSVLAARRLVESGVRFVTVTTGGWDTHGQNFQALSTKLLPPVDQALSTLIQDLSERGLLDSTIVYCAGEFGRTPKVNNKAGRDHWARSMAVVLAGGGFRHGYVHGSTDSQGMAPANDPCTPDDLASTMFHNLGIDPHMELQTTSGRPIQLFREGRIVEKLLA